MFTTFLPTNNASALSELAEVMIDWARTYGITLPKSVYQGIILDCTKGLITNSGECIATTCAVTGSTTGISSPPSGTIAYNADTTTFDCASGYAGSASLPVCKTSGPIAITNSCTPILCTASGTGYLAKTGLAYTATELSGNFACDAAGFTGSISYTCQATGAATTSGTCTPITCNIPSGTTGITDGTTVAYGATSQVCNVAGFTGTISFSSCNTSGNVAGLGGTCTPINCTVTGSTTGISSPPSSIAYNASTTTLTCTGEYTGTASLPACTTGGSIALTNSCTQSLVLSALLLV